MGGREESTKGLLYDHNLLDTCPKISTSYETKSYVVPSGYISYDSIKLSGVG